MKAFKMFNKDMTCTMGRGVFRYEIGKTYTEDEANCAKNGFHCAENPLDCLNYYDSFENSICCEVEAGGSIDEDSRDSKISCTEITIGRRLSLEAFVIQAAIYIQTHPKMPRHRRVRTRPSGVTEDHFVIVCCQKPAAKGQIGDVICCIEEDDFEWDGKKSKTIRHIGVFTIDGDAWKPDTWYGCKGEEVAVDEES